MKAKMKTPAGAATPVGAKMGAETGQATTSNSQNTTAAAGRQIRISDLLGYGPDRGLTLSDLRRLTNLNPRAIRLMIRDERMAGALIISDNRSGYYLTDDAAEVKRFTRSMRYRAKEIEAVAAAVERAGV